jgi:L-fuculose-phosphate aldolase
VSTTLPWAASRRPADLRTGRRSWQALRARRRAARAVVGAAREMAEAGLVIGTVGNVSARTPAGIAITPTRTPYGRMRARDLVFLDLDGAVLGGARAPSREWRLHIEIYLARPDVGAVVHTHSFYATAWSFAGAHPLPQLEELAYYGIGRVEVSRDAPSGSADLARHAVVALGPRRAALLGSHGVVAVGADPADALVAARVVERQAAIAWLLSRDRSAVPA